MGDDSVAAALRSREKLVVIEAPAGSGKTYQGAEYVREVAGRLDRGRVLVLTHTHAACDVFAARTRGQSKVEIRTIDALICAIAGAYHKAIGLPADAASWARSNANGYQKVAEKVAGLVEATPLIARSLAKRYPIVVCDEHQDASPQQHSIVTQLLRYGALLRAFGDPMQRIYGRMRDSEIATEIERWDALKRNASIADELDFPHRWVPHAEELGRWVLAARRALKSGKPVDLRGPLPPNLQIIEADNTAIKHGLFATREGEAKSIYRLARHASPLLVLAAQNAMAAGLRSFFGRSLPIWEGHVREDLDKLAKGLEVADGDANRTAALMVKFIQSVTVGFSASRFADALQQHISNGCRGTKRGLTGQLQSLGKVLLEQPTHKGVAALLRRLHELVGSDPAFKDVRIDYPREFWDAIHLGQFERPVEGLSEITRRRTYARPKLPAKAISTIHKAKGHECDHVIVMPCDGKHFPDKLTARCLLYVAISRASRSLALVVSRSDPSPLLDLPSSAR